jgi:hypothetical protein
MNRFVKTVLIAAIAFTVSTSSASAVTVIDFLNSGGGAGGTLTISGSNVSGSGIFVDTVTIVGANANNGTFDVNGAGACLDASGGCGLLSFNNSGSGTITLVGSIPALGILSPITLLSGDLSGGVTVQQNDGVNGSVTASGNDTKAAALLQALNLDLGTQFGLFGFTLGANTSGGGSPYTAFSVDIANTSQGGGGGGQPVTPVPEPGSLLLFGTGLIALSSQLRRRFGNRSKG